MKLEITRDFKKLATTKELETVKELARVMEEDEATVLTYAQMVMRAITGENTQFEYFRARATASVNRRVHNRYFDGSGRLDVWVEFLAFETFAGAYDCGVYLSDIWDLCGNKDKELRPRMYVNAFEKKRSL